MIKKILWYLQYLKIIRDKDNKRRTTKEVFDMRNKVHGELLTMDREEKDTTRHKAWLEALDWVLGGP